MRFPISAYVQNSVRFALCAALVTLFMSPGMAFAATHKHTKKAHHARSLVDGTASYADIVIDAETGRILHATNPDRLRHPASLTKMMTLYLTFQAIENGHLGLNQYLPISSNAAEQSPSKLGLHAGQRIRVEDAILGLVTESANDAAVVLAEWLGGSESGFGVMMTRQALALGMNNSKFDNPSGLPDPNQVTTARDMAILGHALIYHFPQFYPYFSHDSFVYAGVYHHNHNHLMDRYDGMDGIKTGYIRASGFNLVASAKRGTTRLIGVVFGGHSTTARDNRMALLLDDCFVQAEKEKTSQRMASATSKPGFPQGDGDADTDDDTEYVALPAKVASIFPPKGDATKDPTMRDGSPKGNADPVGGTATWGVQIGAYSDPAIGQQALNSLVQSMPDVLGTAEPQVQKISTSNKTTMYRARLMSLDQKTAQSVCAYMTQHGQSCLTVNQ